MKRRNLRFFLALWLGKHSSAALKLLHRNASHFPGELALKLCPDFLSRIPRPEKVVCITGTNGKTTTSNLLGDILRLSGRRITHNSLGSNTHTGISTVLLQNADLLGRPRNSLALLETDERASVHILPYLKPDLLMINNLLRDTFKRNAHPGFIAWILGQAVPKETVILRNGDDPMCYGVGLDTNPRLSFSLAIPDTGTYRPEPFEEHPVCPVCGHELHYDLRRYSHLGLHRCPACGWAPPAADYVLTDVDREARTFTVSVRGKERRYHLINDSLANIYNFTAAVSVLDWLGLSDEEIRKGFEQAKIVASRVKEYNVAGRHISMLLTKGMSPVACNNMFTYVIRRDEPDKLVVLMLEDQHDAKNDVENTCWFYDCDYELFNDPSIPRLIIAGKRCMDQKLRLLTAGIPEEKLTVLEDIPSVLDTEELYRAKNIYFLYDIFTDGEAEKLRKAAAARMLAAEGGADK